MIFVSSFPTCVIMGALEEGMETHRRVDNNGSHQIL